MNTTRSELRRSSTTQAPVQEAVVRFEALNAILLDAAREPQMYLEQFEVAGGGE